MDSPLPWTPADFPIGNLPLREHHRALREKGHHPAATAWISAEDLARVRPGDTLFDAAGTTLLHPQTPTSRRVAALSSFLICQPWHWLLANADHLAQLDPGPPLGDIHPLAVLHGRVHLGARTRILAGVVIEGPVTLAEDCLIGPNAYIRGHTSIGPRCHVGHAVEIKHSILLEDTHVGHLSYVGDSILGRRVNLGGGTITANFRHDGRTHPFRSADGRLHDTGLQKLGAIIGDDVSTGIHTSIYPGRYLPPGTTTLPGSTIRRPV